MRRTRVPGLLKRKRGVVRKALASKEKRDAKEPMTKSRKMTGGLANVADPFAFWVSNGTYVNNLHQLAEVLENIGEETFRSHVNEGKNDFSQWIRDVVGELELAERLQGTLDQKDHHVMVLKHLVQELSKK